jgi:hypothetical protein
MTSVDLRKMKELLSTPENGSFPISTGVSTLFKGTFFPVGEKGLFL